MSITYGDAKRLLAQYAGRGGKCPDAEGVNVFIRQVMQYMLFSGQEGSLRKFCFHAVGGCFTAPPELEMPLTVKVDGVVGLAWSKWFEWYNYDENQTDGCQPAANALFEELNLYSTVYDLPECGGFIGIVGTCKEEAGAHVLVQGVDISGREIITDHKGEMISGEYISIKQGVMSVSNVKFAKITGLTKTKTQGYVQIYSVNPDVGKKTFLSDYPPYETAPQYKRFRITFRCPKPYAKISVIGRIRIKDHYADNDILPFDNLYTMTIAAQAVQAEGNNDVQISAAKDAKMVSLIERETEYKRGPTSQPMDVYFPTSGGAIKNIIF